MGQDLLEQLMKQAWRRKMQFTMGKEKVFKMDGGKTCIAKQIAEKKKKVELGSLVSGWGRRT